MFYKLCLNITSISKKLNIAKHKFDPYKSKRQKYKNLKRCNFMLVK